MVSLVLEELALLLVFVLFSFGAVAGLFIKSNKYKSVVTYTPTIIAAFFLIILSLDIILNDPVKYSIYEIEHLAKFEIEIDGISSFFLLLVGVVSFAISIYSLSYSKKYDDMKNNSSLGMLLNLFIISMILVLVSNNAFFFLIFWELMSLTSFFLVIYEHEKQTNIKSGLSYLAMTHFGTGFILASFFMMYTQTGSFSFDSFNNGFSGHIRDIAFVLAFIGFGTKAGLVPFHTWLPKAHPSAPSNASALMSGVMLKVAVYGMVRFAFDFASTDSSSNYLWWGVVMIAVGSASALIGVLYALIDQNIKRTLAFSSIENIGIIFIGLGLSMVFLSFNLTSLSILAFIASMFHVLNHAIFKALLFMSAGSIHYSTGTKNIEDLGGLIKKMPWTAVLFLVGSIALIGLPPLNGFISEWLTLQSFLAISQIPSSILQVSLAFASLALVLTIGLSAATFVKLFGISFLSKSRSVDAAKAIEVPRFMLIGKAILASFCVLFGVMPFMGINLITTAFSLPNTPIWIFDPVLLKNTTGSNFAGITMPMLIVIFTSVFVGLFLLIRFTSNNKTKLVGTWDCGFGSLSKRTQYTGTSLTEPLRRVFGAFFRPTNEITRELEQNQYNIKSINITSSTHNIFDEKLYPKITSTSLAVLNKIRKIQTGKVNVYVLYIMIALIALLLFAGVVINE